MSALILCCYIPDTGEFSILNTSLKLAYDSQASDSTGKKLRERQI